MKRRPVIGEVRLLRSPLADRPAPEQPDLRRHEIEGVDRLHVLLAGLLVADSNGRRIGFERHRGAVDRPGQQGREYRASEAKTATRRGLASSVVPFANATA